MTTRRAFLATAFGAATARALPKPKYWAGADWGRESYTVLQIVNVNYATKTVTFGRRVTALDCRVAQVRLDVIRREARYWLNKPAPWPDGIYESSGD